MKPWRSQSGAKRTTERERAAEQRMTVELRQKFYFLSSSFRDKIKANFLMRKNRTSWSKK